ncbi:MAG: methyl-accepting chemotaxis protein [Geobacteraceae bacterium]|nr:methyl-accepting chemotaxis protein [Geobacteraceae bacterium]
MLKNMKLGTKLMSSFLLVALISLIIGVFGYLQVHKLDTADTKLYRQIAVPLGQLTTISTDFQRIRVNSRDIVYAEKDDREEFAHRIQELSSSMDKEAIAYEKTLFSEDGKQLFRDYKDAESAYLTVVKRLTDQATQGKIEEAITLLKGDANTTSRKLQNAIAKLVESKIKQGKLLSENNTSLAKSSGWLMIGLSIAGTILAFILGNLITRAIVKPVSALADDARRMAAGDLQVVIATESSDEIGQLSNAFSTMAGNLKTTISQVSETAGTVATASNQLSSTAEQLATGTEEMAAQANTVATASEEMAATSTDIARNCLMAAESAQRAADASRDGAAIAQQTTEGIRYRINQTAMNAEIVAKLGSRSDQIGAIVGTIEDIADQTNLLALNAAIEAARAGEMGRGFAVVADEVRALAERTTKATKEISEMIKAMQVETGTAVSSMQTGVSNSQRAIDDSEKLESALNAILTLVNEVTLQVSQIATAAEEQTATTNEITNNITEMSQVVQDTSRGAHESAGAANDLSQMAEQLQTLVQKFKL